MELPILTVLPLCAGSVSTDMGFGHARSATMTDETLTTVLLLSQERGHTGQSGVTESTCAAGHHTVPGKEIRKSQESIVHSARLCAVS